MGLHTEKPGTITTGVAGGAITKRRFVNYQDTVCNAIGQLAKGVSREEDTDIGKTYAIVIDGTALVEAGDALVVGDQVTTNGLGKAIQAAKGRYVNGVVMRSQAVAGQLVEIRLGGNMVSTMPSTTSTTTTSSSSSSTTTTTAA
jgi:hypothetical protein